MRSTFQGGAESKEVREDGFGAGGAELFGVVRAGGDAPAGEAAVVRGFHVEGGIADEEGRFGASVENF